nr:type II secretion system secretin GspD [uncultured Caldimonas sp.]
MKLNWPDRLARKLTCVVVAGALAALHAPVALAQQARGDAAAADQVTLNFVNADIEGVARAMGVILKRQFVVDPRVKGTMTLYSEQPMSRSDAYLSFLAALRGLGFAVVQVEGLYKIVPEADAKLQTGTVSAGPAPQVRGDQIVTQIFRVNHENANNLVTILRPLISPNNTINVNPGNNSLVITDYADNLRRLSKIIAALDIPNSTDVEVIPLQHAVASDIAVLVQRLSDLQVTSPTGAPQGGAPAPAAAGGGGGGTVLADPRTNSLLVRAPNPARMNVIRSLVQQLDRPGQGGTGGSGIHVVYLKNADAVRLAQVLRAAFTTQGQGGGGAAGGGGGGTSLAAAVNQATNLGNNAGNGGASPQATAPVSSAAQPSTGGFIQADPATNALIITAPDPLYRQLRSVIDQLDTRRAQVYVESMIVEVSADKAAEFGIQWQGIIGNSGNEYLGGIGTNFGSGSNNILGATRALIGGKEGLAAADLPGNGLNIGIARKFGSIYTLGLLARALESNSDTNILSTPNLITLDNEEAKIVVGKNVPFVTGQYTNTGTGTTSPFQTIERKDVGLTLRIKPQIGENGTVRLTIFQESSDVIGEATGTTNVGPETTKRSIESTVVVDDGQIIVLGGLMQDQYSDGRSKVPVLGDVPVLGGLFRSENRTRRKTNLMVFLRPVVMRDQDSAGKFSLDRYDLIRAQQKETQPTPRVLVPVNEAPVLPPLEVPQAPDSATPPQPGKQEPPPPLTPNTPIER